MYKGHQPRHIASTLGITENEVYNIKKRIVRVLKTIPRTYTSIIEPIIKVKLKGFPEPQTFGKN
jgi:hypothetical protein